MKNSKSNSFWKIWGAPIGLTVLTLFGLVAALVGTGIWHGLAWLAIAMPVAVCIWYGWMRPGRRPVR